MKYNGKKYKRMVVPMSTDVDCAKNCDLYPECGSDLSDRCMQKDVRKGNFGQYKEKKS